ncbi:P-loop NTPase fold protein [Cypionkella sp.]|uniref:KAP family P-loop NTPase fold protein n=1 Tax=Cypionkella sp. TaxID=2811411 RepID=UPI00272BA563|nr:P-loop NTPase fold protein [Cypionkella sp.]MDP2049071.1 P-loop NTPase fold protein [Cypionkella sp.]
MALKQHLDEIGDVLAGAVSSEVRDSAKNLWTVEKERKDAVKSFKELLVKLTEDEVSPIVIVIDELDRCRPDYALSVLEVIKHFFAVPKVHFILGINGVALENSVKARYGAEMDAESYLRKFINVSFSLPRVIPPESKGLHK